MKVRLSLLLLYCALAAMGGLVHAATRCAEEEVRETVAAMNRAVTERDMDAALASFAPGAVKLDLRAAHAAGAEPAGRKSAEPVAGLAERWKSVAAILFPATHAYVRTAEDMRVHVDGDLAVVWATIKTETAPRDASGHKQNRFQEVYVLHRIEGEWKIVAMSDNRRERYDDKGGSPSAGEAR